ncbi:MAG: hypothetical protein ACRDL6_12710, partial [Solirubrobacterales bacterium]
MANSISRRTLALISGTALVLSFLAFLIASAGDQADATHQPADKVIASGSKVEVFGPGQEVTLLSGQVRSSSTSDLMLQVTAECALTTNVTTVGNDDQSAEGTVEVWVEIDGQPVGINNIGTSTTSSEAQDDGKAVFCNRAYRRQTELFDDEDATIRTFFDTRNANGFNWVALNVGNGIHTIEVKANLTETATNNATAE